MNTLHEFQVYNPIVHHLYTVFYAHHPKSNLPPAPRIWPRSPSASFLRPSPLVTTKLLSIAMWLFVYLVGWFAAFCTIMSHIWVNFLFNKDNCHIGLGDHPFPAWPHVHWINYICNDPISKIRVSTYELWGGVGGCTHNHSDHSEVILKFFLNLIYYLKRL